MTAPSAAPPPAGLRPAARPGQPGTRRITARRAVAVAVAVLLGVTGVTATIAARRPPRVSGLLMQGIAADPCAPGRVLAVPVGVTGHFEAGTSVLLTGRGVLTARGVTAVSAAQARCDAAAATASRQWLRAGQVPGATVQQRSMAARALLDLGLLVRPNGAVVAAWHGSWRYAWPRDSSWVAVALADSGHLTTALRILRFLQRVQPAGGSWAARYHLDGAPVSDGRPAELDSAGWVPWAVWSWVSAAARPGSGVSAAAARRDLAGLWPMVTAAANAAARSRTRDGLPGPALDYWESSVGVTLGTAAPLLAGLRAAAALAPRLDDAGDGRRWAAAAGQLSAAMARTFGSGGYQRTPSPHSGADAAVTFLGPPLAAPGRAVRQAARHAQSVLRQPDGGLLPGSDWTGSPGVAWTAETALFALFDATTARPARATSILSWLAARRTRLGELPEQVNAAGQPVAVAPLAWTDAIVLLALLSQSRSLATVPASPAAPAAIPAARPATSAAPAARPAILPASPAARPAVP